MLFHFCIPRFDSCRRTPLAYWDDALTNGAAWPRQTFSFLESYDNSMLLTCPLLKNLSVFLTGKYVLLHVNHNNIKTILRPHSTFSCYPYKVPYTKVSRSESCIALGPASSLLQSRAVPVFNLHS